jgi:hypothetical protein
MMRAARRAAPALAVALVLAWQYRAPLVGRVWYFEDIAAYFVPLYAAAARSMRAGEFPTWALGAWSGQPLVGDPQLGLFYPPNWLWLLLAPARLYAWLQLFHVAVGAAGMWALARARGRSTAATALAAITLGLGAFVVLELRHAMFVATTAWLPWLWWAIERWAERRAVEDVVAIVLTAALAVLGGGWSMLPFGLAAVAVVAIARARVVVAGAARRRFVAGLLLGGALALSLSSVQILPALAHARLSPRGLGVSYAFAASYSWPSWRYLVTLALPTWYGDDARGTYVGASNQWELCGYGIGLVGTLLALASLVERERRGERLALLVATLLACDLALGGHGLLHPLVFAAPLFSSLRCPARALYLWTIAAPVLAADGLDAFVARLRLRARAHAIVPAIVVVAVAAELIFTWRGDNPSTTLAEADRAPAAIGWLRDHPTPGRATNDVHLPQRFHNMGLRWGFESAGGYHSLPIWRYLHLLWIANHGAPYPHAQLSDDLTAQGLWRFSSPIVDLLGVQWVVSPHDRAITAKQFRRVFAGDDGLDVWQNVDAFPLAYVVHRAIVAADEPAAARAVSSPTWRPSRVAIVEPLPSGAAPTPDVPAPQPGEVLPEPATVQELVRLGPSSLDVEVTLASAGVLVVAEPWYPGWSARVDGRPAQLLRVDYALRGVTLPPGRHVVEMVLDCPPLRHGATITLLTLVAVAAVTLGRARRRQRM